jgi:hypothetical protein
MEASGAMSEQDETSRESARLASHLCGWVYIIGLPFT